ncbi:hypothetical protein D3C75_1191480 [compost metagenome]
MQTGGQVERNFAARTQRKTTLGGVQQLHLVLPTRLLTFGLSQNVHLHEPKDCHSDAKGFSLIHGLKDG